METKLIARISNHGTVITIMYRAAILAPGSSVMSQVSAAMLAGKGALAYIC